MATATLVSILMLALFFVLIFIGVPIYVCMMSCGLIGSAIIMHNFAGALTFLSDAFVSTFTGYTFAVAPMFIFMGEIASESGIGTNLFNAFKIILGRIPGALASAVQVACAIFGAICGSAVATSGLMRRVACPEMKRANYSDELSAGAVGGGATLSTLIPPSMPLITYGAATQTSIGQLFFGGIFTGIVLMLLFIAVVQIWCVIQPSAGPRGAKTTAKEKLKALKEGNIIEVVVVFGFSMAGMFTGWFTPTEAGAIGAVLMLLVVIINRRFSFKMLGKAVLNSLMMGGMMYCLLAGTAVFGKLFTLAQLSTTIGHAVAALHLNGFTLVMVLTIIFAIAGCFMDAMAAVLITAPLFLPVLNAFGYSSVWYGCYAVMITGLGAITPPVGMGCYIITGITGIPLQKCFKGAAPFIIAFLVMAILMAVFPEIAMWLPNHLVGAG